MSLVFANAHDYNKASAVKPAGVAAGGEGGSALAAIMGTADEDLADDTSSSRVSRASTLRGSRSACLSRPQRTSEVTVDELSGRWEGATPAAASVAAPAAASAAAPAAASAAAPAAASAAAPAAAPADVGRRHARRRACRR